MEVRRGRGGGAVVRRPGLEAVGRYVALLLQLGRRRSPTSKRLGRYAALTGPKIMGEPRLLG